MTNPECLRDTLLEIESDTGYKRSFVLDPSQIPPGRLAHYLHDEVAWHLVQCRSKGLVFGYVEDVLGCIYVDGLSDEGEKCLNAVRDDSRWAAIKRKLSEVTVSPTFGHLISIISAFVSAFNDA